MINEGLIWTYYDCSYACYLFGKWDVNCFWMIVTPLIICLIGIIPCWIIFKIWNRFRIGGKC